jgi:anti-anti-sigma factor
MLTMNTKNRGRNKMTDNEAVIQIPERFDFSFNLKFTELLQAITDDEKIKTLTLDFNYVNYLDSSALGMLVLAHKKAKKINIKTKISKAKGAALEVLNMAHMNKLYEYS